jgi:hypothetical protein
VLDRVVNFQQHLSMVRLKAITCSTNKNFHTALQVFTNLTTDSIYIYNDDNKNNDKKIIAIIITEILVTIVIINNK